MAQNDTKKTLSLYGNLGRGPREHTSPAKSGTRRYYDAVIDEMVEEEYTYPESHFLTYSIATGGYNDRPLRWHNCVDWEGEGFRLRKGDRVKLDGYFENRTYVKDGEERTERQFVVQNVQILKVKAPEID